MACLTSMIEPLRVANEISGSNVFKWQLLSEDGLPVTASAAITFDVADALSIEPVPHYLVFLSPPKCKFKNTQSLGRLRHLSRHGCVLCSVSGGVFPLAKTKLAVQVEKTAPPTKFAGQRVFLVIMASRQGGSGWAEHPPRKGKG